MVNYHLCAWVKKLVAVSIYMYLSNFDALTLTALFLHKSFLSKFNAFPFSSKAQGVFLAFTNPASCQTCSYEAKIILNTLPHHVGASCFRSMFKQRSRSGIWLAISYSYHRKAGGDCPRRLGSIATDRLSQGRSWTSFKFCLGCTYCRENIWKVRLQYTTTGDKSSIVI